MQNSALALLLAASTILATDAPAAVDTLKDTTEIEDCVIYAFSNCNPEVFGEDCRRYNSGGVTSLTCGNTRPDNLRRILLAVPGYDGSPPDSAELLLFCHSESDTLDRRLFAYPLTREFYEGSEVLFGIGNYPDPDSGATWNHAWLDDGDNDSLSWVTPGGDFTTEVACTVTITGTGSYFGFRHFDRILNYWDTSGHDYGCIIVNENAEPASTSNKTFRSSEYGGNQPLLVLYHADDISTRRRRAAATLLRGNGE